MPNWWRCCKDATSLCGPQQCAVVVLTGVGLLHSCPLVLKQGEQTKPTLLQTWLVYWVLLQLSAICCADQVFAKRQLAEREVWAKDYNLVTLEHDVHLLIINPILVDRGVSTKALSIQPVPNWPLCSLGRCCLTKKRRCNGEGKVCTSKNETYCTSKEEIQQVLQKLNYF